MFCGRRVMQRSAADCTMQVPNKLASLVPKEVVRRPPRSQVQRLYIYSCCACRSSARLQQC